MTCAWNDNVDNKTVTWYHTRDKTFTDDYDDIFLTVDIDLNNVSMVKSTHGRVTTEFPDNLDHSRGHTITLHNVTRRDDGIYACKVGVHTQTTVGMKRLTVQGKIVHLSFHL